MKKWNFKKNLVLTLVMALLFTAIQWPQSMVTAVSAEQQGAKSQVSISENEVYDASFTYNAKPLTNPDLRVVSGNTTVSGCGIEYIWYSVSADGTRTKLEDGTTPTDAGKYVVEAVLENTEDFELVEKYEKEVTISPKTITAQLSGESSKSYDATTKVLNEKEFKVDLKDVYSADKDAVTATISKISFASAKVGDKVDIIAEIKLTGEAAGNYTLGNSTVKNSNGKITQADSLVTAEVAAKLKDIKVTCGQELSEVKLGEEFEWVTPDVVVKTGGETTFEVYYTKNADGKNYKKIITSATVKVVCDKKTIKAKKATKNKAGNIKYYECSGCKKLYDEDGKVITKAETILPYFKNLKVGIKTKKVYKLEDYMVNGTSTFVKMTVPKKYKSFITVNNKKKTITVNTKKYSNLPSNKTAYVTLKYKGGTKKINIVINVAKPTLKVTKKAVFYQGQDCYFYTIDYNAKNATRVEVKVKSGVKKATKNGLNKSFKKIFKKNKGNGTFAVGKGNVTGKTVFQITAYYGKIQVTTTKTVK